MILAHTLMSERERVGERKREREGERERERERERRLMQSVSINKV